MSRKSLLSLPEVSNLREAFESPFQIIGRGYKPAAIFFSKIDVISMSEAKR